MRNTVLCAILFCAALILAAVGQSSASSSYFTSYCQSCHSSAGSTCAGCHSHGVHSSSLKNDINISGKTDKTTYAPGENVSVTIAGGYRSGWVRAILYDQNMNEMARSTGPTGQGGGASFPITLTASAPLSPGTYTWNVSWYGNKYDKSSPFMGPRWRPDPNNPNHGEEIVSTNSFTVAAQVVTDKIGIYNNGEWYLDMDNSGAWSGTSIDRLRWFGGGLPGAIPVTGDWTGSGTTKIGVFSNGTWYLDLNGNGAWDGTPTDAIYSFGGGLPGAIPVTGDWTGSGTTKIGVFSNGTWYLDLNGNGAWDDTPTDKFVANFGMGITDALPITGKWTADGLTKIGVYANGMWYLDLNGNGVWDGTPTDALYSFGGGLARGIPMTGDWTGSGTTKIGIYEDGSIYLDADGNGVWNGTPADSFYMFGQGITGAVPVVGKW